VLAKTLILGHPGLNNAAHVLAHSLTIYAQALGDRLNASTRLPMLQNLYDLVQVPRPPSHPDTPD
jgi:hypothetical protein